MTRSAESLRHAVATYRHNFTGTCTILGLMAAIALTLLIICASHAPSGSLLCGALTAGHLIAYGIIALFASLSPILIKNARADWLNLRQSRRELRLSLE